MKIYLYILSSIVLFSCDKNTGNNNNESKKRKDTIAVSTIRLDTTSGLYSLKFYISKKPKETGMFEDSVLNGRLKKLLGKDYPDFKDNWNRESPLIEVENVLHSSGCKNRNCAFNEYDLFVDLNNDIINVYHLRHGREVIYKEGDKLIKLPKELQSEIRQREKKQKPYYHPPHLQDKTTETTQ